VRRRRHLVGRRAGDDENALRPRRAVGARARVLARALRRGRLGRPCMRSAHAKVRRARPAASEARTALQPHTPARRPGGVLPLRAATQQGRPRRSMRRCRVPCRCGEPCISWRADHIPVIWAELARSLIVELVREPMRAGSGAADGQALPLRAARAQARIGLRAADSARGCQRLAVPAPLRRRGERFELGGQAADGAGLAPDQVHQLVGFRQGVRRRGAAAARRANRVRGEAAVGRRAAAAPAPHPALAAGRRSEPRIPRVGLTAKPAPAELSIHGIIWSAHPQRKCYALAARPRRRGGAPLQPPARLPLFRRVRRAGPCRGVCSILTVC